MRLSWKQLDPDLADKVSERLARAVSVPPARVLDASPENRLHASASDHAPRSLNAGWSAFALFVSVLVVSLYVNVCFNLTGPAFMLLMTLFPVAMLAAVTAPGAGVASKHRPRIWATSPERLRALLSDAAETRAERLYSEIVALLADAPLAPRVGREVLREVNTLLQSSARLHAQRRKLLRLQGGDGGAAAIAGAQSEHATLLRRAHEEGDPIARRALGESADLCRERLEHLQALAPTLVRLDAHQEMICQALDLALSALTREQVTPVSLHAPDIARLRTAVRQVSDQTRAVEEAVVEVAGL